MKFRSKFNHGFTNRDCLHCGILEASKARYMQFFLENVQHEIFKILGMFKYNTKFIWAACWISLKIITETKTTHSSYSYFYNYCWSLFRCNYKRPVILWNSTSWSRLKLTVQIRLVLSPCDPFLTNNRNMTGNSVEKCFEVLNVKLEVKPRSKTLYWLHNLLSTAFA